MRLLDVELVHVGLALAGVILLAEHIVSTAKSRTVVTFITVLISVTDCDLSHKSQIVISVTRHGCDLSHTT